MSCEMNEERDGDWIGEVEGRGILTPVKVLDQASKCEEEGRKQ